MSLNPYSRISNTLIIPSTSTGPTGPAGVTGPAGGAGDGVFIYSSNLLVPDSGNADFGSSTAFLVTDPAGTQDLTTPGNKFYLEYSSGAVRGGTSGISAWDARGSNSTSFGINNEASGSRSGVFGGSNNVASSSTSAVLGGDSNVAEGSGSVVIGGFTSRASDEYSTSIGGQGNFAAGAYAVVLGGQSNTAFGTASTVLGGENNATFADNSSVISGDGNATNADAQYSTVSGYYGKADSYGERVLSGGGFVGVPNQGVAQVSEYTLRVGPLTTTSPTELRVNWPGFSRIPIDTDETVNLCLEITAISGANSQATKSQWMCTDATAVEYIALVSGDAGTPVVSNVSISVVSNEIRVFIIPSTIATTYATAYVRAVRLRGGLI
jgi:hypothetical protein